jgi:hypothetical protein
MFQAAFIDEYNKSQKKKKKIFIVFVKMIEFSSHILRKE